MIDREIFFNGVRDELFGGALQQVQVGSTLAGSRTLVSALLQCVSPAAIVWLVTFVVVDAIQCFAVRTIAHVREKIAKAVWSLPSFADLNAPPAIRRPKFIFGVLAFSPHPAPSLKYLGSFSYFGMTVTGIDDACSLSLEAATRLDQPTPEMLSCDGFFSAASTSAKPPNVVVGIVASPSNDSQTTKLLACDINEIGHGRSSLQVARSSDGFDVDASARRAF